jgi:HEAT repeat protein
VDGWIEALGYQDDHNVRLAAASALGRISDSRAVDPLISALEDQPRIREVAIMALDEIGNHRAVDSPISVLEDADWKLRRPIAKSLEKSAIRGL